jgi:hypothetical protein
MKVLKGKFAIPGRPIQIREFRWRAKSLAHSLARVQYHARSGKAKQIY